MPTSCPESFCSGRVHKGKYDSATVPTHELSNRDKSFRTVTLTAQNSTTCRVCYGPGAI